MSNALINIYAKFRSLDKYVFTAHFSTMSFLLRATTSLLSSFLEMKLTTNVNAWTILEPRKSVGMAFIAEFRSYTIIGFMLATNSILVLFITINLLKLFYSGEWEGLFEAITIYGLAGSSMALFRKVDGAIYMRDVDIGIDIVRNANINFPKVDPNNLTIIANSVGDNLGNIVGVVFYSFDGYDELASVAFVLLIYHFLGSTMVPLLYSILCLLVQQVLLYVCSPLMLPLSGLESRLLRKLKQN